MRPQESRISFRRRQQFPLHRAVEALEPRLLLCANDGCPDPVPGGLPTAGAAIVQPAASTGTLYPLTAIPALNSDPGAPATLYLDFHGEGAQNWDGSSVPATPAYDIDGDPTTFSAQELTNIQQIWAAASEAYSPFNVNVTTVDPGNWSTGGHHQFRDIIGGTGSWTGFTEGGTAYVGSYADSTLPDTAFVFSANLGNGSPTPTAIDAVHEAGHGFGLQHQSLYSGTTKTSEYNPGNGVTAPFMGNAMNGSRATWWNGQSSLGYNVIQDDLSVLSGSRNGFGYKAQDHGQSPAGATPLTISGTSASGSGIVETTSDQDYFSFTTAAGTCTFSVNVAQYGPMLHAILELHDASNNVIAVANNAATLSQTITANLAAGQYYLVVKSYGQYGDIGQYTLSGTVAAGQVTPASAAFVRADTATEGTWSGVYGADGYSIFNSTSALPSYAQVAASGQQSWTWTSTTDPRAMQTAPGSANRLAACLFSPTSFSLDVNLTDGKSHQVALYMLDWDTSSRVQTVQVTDANSGAVLDTRTVSNFYSGQWLVWNLSGHVKITLTWNAGYNAVASGIAFAPAQAQAPSTNATFVRADTTTEGTWSGVYGADGYSIFNSTSALPSYAQVAASGQQSWTWTSTTDPRAMQTAPGSANRLAACLFSPTSFSLDVNLTDGKSHQVALYMLDWDTSARVQTVQVTDANSGAVLDTRTVSNFYSGQWLVWNLSGHVKITLTWNAGYNAVASGIAFAPAQAQTPSTNATFVRADTTTEGTWSGVYGGDGYSIFNSTSSLPSYAQVTAVNQQNWIWDSSTTDARAMQTAPNSASRSAACLYSTSSFTLDVNLTDGQTHQVALYMLDWDSAARVQTVQVTDANSGAVLDTHTVSNFHTGQWLVWNVTGHIKITLTWVAGYDAAASGILFGPAT